MGAKDFLVLSITRVYFTILSRASKASSFVFPLEENAWSRTQAQAGGLAG